MPNIVLRHKETKEILYDGLVEDLTYIDLSNATLDGAIFNGVPLNKEALPSYVQNDPLLGDNLRSDTLIRGLYAAFPKIMITFPEFNDKELTEDESYSRF